MSNADSTLKFKDDPINEAHIILDRVHAILDCLYFMSVSAEGFSCLMDGTVSNSIDSAMAQIKSVTDLLIKAEAQS